MTVFPAYSFAPTVLFASVLLSIAFAVYGLNILYLTVRSRRYKLRIAPPLSARPTVAIHLPIYNELYVVRRLLDSCVRVAERYGERLVTIYVIDDSDDDTSLAVDEAVSEHSAHGFQFRVIRRGSRQGFKAGALQAALEETHEKHVAVFDADFVPPPDFLDRTVAVLEEDAEVGFVQARWGHIDRDYSAMTKAVAIGVDAHFLLEQRGRNGNGYLMNFNGSAGVLRVSAIHAAGGWASDTLAEDLDISYRMQLVGYRGVYLNDVEVPGELPPTLASLERQQGRWARGSLQAAKKLAGRVRASKRLSVRQKFEAGLHLTYYLVHPLMVASFLLAVIADFLRVDVTRYAVNLSIPTSLPGRGLGNLAAITFQVAPWAVFSALVMLSTLSVLLYCVEAVRVQKLGLLENVKQVIILVVLGYGLSISNSVQALGGIFLRQTGTFSRTPKYAIEQRIGSWSGKKYQLSFGKTTVLEAGAIFLAVLAIAYAWATANLGIVPILIVYLTGYSFVFCLTIAQKMESKGMTDM
ncbi:MAG: glycosyltransferase [Nitrososphaerota archaeon]|nr:glycosyltransferase [Nitrososphaerota archaeon]MDG7026959.1 glycosyltransferase [Nitrososphaerota archaeon]